MLLRSGENDMLDDLECSEYSDIRKHLLWKSHILPARVNIMTNGFRKSVVTI